MKDPIVGSEFINAILKLNIGEDVLLNRSDFPVSGHIGSPIINDWLFRNTTPPMRVKMKCVQKSKIYSFKRIA